MTITLDKQQPNPVGVTLEKPSCEVCGAVIDRAHMMIAYSSGRKAVNICTWACMADLATEMLNRKPAE